MFKKISSLFNSDKNQYKNKTNFVAFSLLGGALSSIFDQPDQVTAIFYSLALLIIIFYNDEK